MSIGHWAIRGIHRIHVKWFNWLKLLTAGITLHIYLIAEPLSVHNPKQRIELRNSNGKINGGEIFKHARDTKRECYRQSMIEIMINMYLQQSTDYSISLP